MLMVYYSFRFPANLEESTEAFHILYLITHFLFINIPHENTTFVRSDEVFICLKTSMCNHATMAYPETQHSNYKLKMRPVFSFPIPLPAICIKLWYGEEAGW